MISFCEFANHLYPYIKEGKKRADFVVFLFDQILDNDCDNPFVDKEAPTLRQYINIKSPRSLPVEDIRNIMPHVIPGKFQTYLESLSDDITEKLVNEFSPSLTNLTLFTFPSICAETFDGILASVANPLPHDSNLVPVEAPSLPNTIIAKYGPRLLIESGNICPNKGCTNFLSELSDDGSVRPIYKIARIDPDGEIAYDNLIALCPSCYSRFIAMPSPTTKASLLKKKQLISSSTSVKGHYSDQQIDEGVDRLLRKIAEIPEDELNKFKTSLPLRYDPQIVAKKIPADSFANKRLLKTALADVSEYFYMVDAILKQLNREGLIRQRKFANQIKGLFISLDEENLSHTEVFNGIRDWIANSTNEDPELCSIVVAYFVQSCEVFDVIS